MNEDCDIKILRMEIPKDDLFALFFLFAFDENLKRKEMRK